MAIMSDHWCPQMSVKAKSEETETGAAFNDVKMRISRDEVEIAVAAVLLL